MLDLEKMEHEDDLHGHSIWSDDHTVYVTRKGASLCKASFEGCDRFNLARQWILEN